MLCQNELCDTQSATDVGCDGLASTSGSTGSLLLEQHLQALGQELLLGLILLTIQSHCILLQCEHQHRIIGCIVGKQERHAVLHVAASREVKLLLKHKGTLHSRFLCFPFLNKNPALKLLS